MAEGRCVQALHVGPYDGEDATAHGLRFNGRHHEIYLSYPNRTATVKLRNPVGDEYCHWQIFS
ncbi:MAG TPA: hypothetical protein QGG37_02795 [Chloroflexota bacterium]|nr:hypothetical protein [Chloroflexota bacterium]